MAALRIFLFAVCWSCFHVGAVRSIWWLPLPVARVRAVSQIVVQPSGEESGSALNNVKYKTYQLMARSLCIALGNLF